MGWSVIVHSETNFPLLFVQFFVGHFDNMIVPYRWPRSVTSRTWWFHINYALDLKLRTPARLLSSRKTRACSKFSQRDYRYSRNTHVFTVWRAFIHTNIHTYIHTPLAFNMLMWCSLRLGPISTSIVCWCRLCPFHCCSSHCTCVERLWTRTAVVTIYTCTMTILE